MTTDTRTSVDVYVDVLCPWCYIGHRRLQTVLAGMPDRRRPAIGWRALELSPGLSRVPGETAAEQMASGTWWGEGATARIAHIHAIGASEGLELNLHLARPVNSFDAHRLVKLAATCGRADQTMETLLRGYHTEGLNIADHDVLEGIGVAAGLDRTDIRAMLAGSTFEADVRADELLARRHGVASVPSLMVGDRSPVSGVLSTAELRQVLDAGNTASRPD